MSTKTATEQTAPKVQSIEDDQPATPAQSQTNQPAEKKSSVFSSPLGKVSILDVSFSLRHLALTLKSGLSISECLEIQAEQSTDIRLKKAFERILQDIQQGKTLAESMSNQKKIFPELVTSIVSVGEQAGTLETNLIFISEHLRKSYELQKKVKGALIYPAIVFGMTFVEMVGVLFYILPKLDALFSSFQNVPAFTMTIVNMAKFVRSNVFYIAGCVLLLYIISRIFFNTKIGKIVKDRLSLSFPIVKKLTRSNLLASTSRTISILLESGINISKAIRITSETIGNSVYQKALEDVHTRVKGGENLADSFRHYPSLFPTTYVKLIEAGEKTGTLEENLIYLYDTYSEEVSEMANNLTTVLEPILLIFVGCLIGLLAITIVAPIYQFTSSING